MEHKTRRSVRESVYYKGIGKGETSMVHAGRLQMFTSKIHPIIIPLPPGKGLEVRLLAPPKRKIIL